LSYLHPTHLFIPQVVELNTHQMGDAATRRQLYH
jgi:hypothetical protein